jgi:signal transduction histidine kinase
MMGQIVGALMKDALVSGNAQITLRRVDLNAAIGTICQYYQAAAARKSSWIIWEPLSFPAYAWTDSAAVAAVMDNLLSNAIKYAPPGKQITVSMRAEGVFTGKAPFGQAPVGEVVAYVVLVRDQGPGIGAEDQTRLFQRGVRLSAQPTGNEPSHGYGLAVAKELLDLLGGEIWCESELGEGTTFFFRLPAWRGEIA